jgi:purine-binding chemotaxis protein CheW
MITQLCTFRLGDLLLGIDVQQVQEVIRFQKMTRVPLAPRVVEGLINLRGQIVTAIDLRYRLGLPARDPESLPINVVIRTSDGAVSLLVDDIGDVVEVDDAHFEPTPPTLNSCLREAVHGVYKLEERLLLLLDVERAMSAVELV